jgi:HPr kinase/phosphorylase
MITSRFINAATIIMEDLTAPQMRVQGTMVDIMGIGVLIEGQAGIGKSETALTLIERGHSLVSDDITMLRKSSSGQIIGSPVELTRYHMEIRGLGIIHVPSLFGVASMRREMALDVIIRLHPWDPEQDDDRTGLNVQTRDLMGVSVPLLTLPVAPGRDMAHVIEVAALNQKLKYLGHDAAKELDDKLVGVLMRKGKA